mmetsp:Transcript_47971/g.35173  ORF Transcript_47971/g.35173 Transcript_47971/m.35173 type:complete len:86 (+) Transcript_47971:773-1030(+)
MLQEFEYLDENLRKREKDHSFMKERASKASNEVSQLDFNNEISIISDKNPQKEKIQSKMQPKMEKSPTKVQYEDPQIIMRDTSQH